jgi:hypothetical protein
LGCFGAGTAAHIHVSAPGVNGGVSTFFCGGGGRPPCPMPPATITGQITPDFIVGPGAQGIDTGDTTAFAELVRAIRSGYTYVNVHSTRWPTGEIRGQIE